MKQKSEKKGPPKISAEEEARFLEYMRAVEGDGPQTTLFELLVSDGVCLPRPEELADSELSAKLWEVIHALRNHGAILYNTDHLMVMQKAPSALFRRLGAFACLIPATT